MNDIFIFLITYLMTPAFCWWNPHRFPLQSPHTQTLKFFHFLHLHLCALLSSSLLRLNFLFSIAHSHSPFQLSCTWNSALYSPSLSVSPPISHIHVSSFFQSFLSKPHLYFHLLLHSLARASPSLSPPFMYIPYFTPPNLFGTNSIIYQILSFSFFICGIKTSPSLDI